ncbi:hypothetical protein A2954_06325 [Candidatus Roizmanbacteria bacterium RIFCSPLOWO2_01_FULL_37_12]|uniref:VRR-NUC domain-containing protein n=1 Tax=Candidatus Roizmanbacteria bacterium RIFCSPLOWO2_01_FULL_37_12 TaxID=1802056 RepID=A0A1F7IAS6_9BACT|nr:MAG: hypothetical protein A2768_01665 [Candidatus Roizmanbacteria bacterium RIFCSPHIGHO2_01_FULL_37_16]OGK25771.1 MAG: hypothetical protein A3D76_02170 [Candidatus Roizmanbacteria bacterium RIFCSPHIGHO2_02_FULL_37_9b]OGK40473.1 MAG: hypothetical protein A2954_06325 [Candidatus Roizmanbacteria bacterium RIFCSPLOWO2_01_FULL_37_12]
MKTLTVQYDQSLVEKWRIGNLSSNWKKKYPDLFDADDLRIALTQPSYHFAEWIAAIYFYKQGYKILVEQYIYAPHVRKLAIIKEKLGDKGLAFLRRKEIGGKVQPPDLFIYNEKKFFFAEVKTPKDRLRELQKKFFEEIEKYFSTTVKIVNLINK